MTPFDLIDGVWAILVTTILTAEVILALQVLGVLGCLGLVVVLLRRR